MRRTIGGNNEQVVDDMESVLGDPDTPVWVSTHDSSAYAIGLYDRRKKDVLPNEGAWISCFFIGGIYNYFPYAF